MTSTRISCLRANPRRGALWPLQIRRELSARAAAFTRRAGRQPGLSIVLVGDKADSQIYVNSKLKSAADEGMSATLSHLPASASLDEILSLDRTGSTRIRRPTAFWSRRRCRISSGAAAMQQVFDAIDPAKDVDGVTPSNVGRLVQNRAELVACTPAGIMELLKRSGIEIAGKHAVVIGRSDIVGKPVVAASAASACDGDDLSFPHAGSAGNCRDRRHPVAALGRPGFVRRSFVKPGATVIDVGINLVTDAGVAHGDFREGHPRRGAVRAQGLGAGRRRASGGRRGRRGAHAGSRRRRSADDRDADGEHD